MVSSEPADHSSHTGQGSLAKRSLCHHPRLGLTSCYRVGTQHHPQAPSHLKLQFPVPWLLHPESCFPSQSPDWKPQPSQELPSGRHKPWPRGDKHAPWPQAGVGLLLG